MPGKGGFLDASWGFPPQRIVYLSALVALGLVPHLHDDCELVPAIALELAQADSFVVIIAVVVEVHFRRIPFVLKVDLAQESRHHTTAWNVDIAGIDYLLPRLPCSSTTTSPSMRCSPHFSR